MRLFQNEVLSQAVQLRANSAALPQWLNQARDALGATREGAEAAPSSLALRLAAIEGWPSSPKALSQDLDALARPVADFLSRAFCKVGVDAYGAPSASLWGSSAKLTAVDGRIEISRSKEGEALSQLSLPEVFERCDWLSVSPLAGSPESSSAPMAPKTPERDLAVSLRGAPDDFLADLASDQGRAPEEMSPSALRLRDRVNVMFATRDPELAGAQTLLMSDGELIEKGDFLNHGSSAERNGAGVNIQAAGSPTPPASGKERDYSAELGFGLLGLPLSQSSELWSGFRKAALRSAAANFSLRLTPESGSEGLGFERGESLLRALDACGARALETAKRAASERLSAFIDQNAPGLRSAAMSANKDAEPLGALLEIKDFKAALSARREAKGLAEPDLGPQSPKGPK